MIGIRWTKLEEFKYFESWFIASTPNNPTINAWFQEFNLCFQKFDMKDSYLDYLKTKFGMNAYNNMVQGNTMPAYLKIHMTLQKVMQIDGVAPFSGINAADIEYGPLALSNLVDFDEEKMVKMFMIEPWPSTLYQKRYQGIINSSSKSNELPLPRYFKIRNFDRKWIQVYFAAQTSFPFTIGSMLHAAFFNGGDYGWFFNNFLRILYYGAVGKPGKIHSQSLYCQTIDLHRLCNI